MKRMISFVLALTMLFSTLAFSTAAYAVEYVTVYLNDKLLDFPTTDARPQIINNRTYVPVRRTCEALGLTLDWNSKTETMTLTRDGVVIAHTMRSKTVLVNGEAKPFDTASINKNNRILMPIRMIAESVGATVTWDDPTRSVHITTTSSNSSNNNSSNNNSANVTSATVSSVTASKTAVAKDTEITVSAVCSKDTTSVKFLKSSDKSEIGSVSKYTENSDGTRTFTTEYKCENNTNADTVVTIDAIAGIGSNYNESLEAVKSVSIIVSNESSSKDNSSDKDSDSDSDTSYKSDNMISCKLTSNKIKTNDYAKFKVKTKSKAKKVKLTTDANSQSSVISDYSEDDDGYRTFSGKLKMTKEGSCKVYVTLYVSGDYEKVYETYNVTVSDDYKSNSGSDELEIIDMWTNNNYGYKGYDTTLFVKTSTDVDYLELLTGDQDEGEGVRTHSTASKNKNYYYWEFDFEVKKTGDTKYKLLAYNDAGESVSDSFTLEGRAASKSDPAVISVEQKTSSIIEGEKAKFNIVVTTCVNRLRITRGTSETVFDKEYDNKSSSSSYSTKTITAEFEVDDVNSDYYVTAYDDDDSDKMKFKIVGDTAEKIKIEDVDVKDDSISEDDDVELTVTTTNSAYRVWVEDNRGKQISKIYKTPDDEDGSKYVWEISFSPLETGRQNFTIIAQDENKETDSWDFKVTVK